MTHQFYAKLTPAQLAALDTGRNIALRAGAGSGKTTVLTRRFLWLLEHGAPGRPGGPPIPLEADQIVTLTFTRKAAEEMRHRIGEAIGERLADAQAALQSGLQESGGDATRLDKLKREVERWRRARTKLDIAPINTIHGFCRSLLEEFSLAGGMEPAFDIVDELDDALIRDEAVAQAIDALQSPGDGEKEGDEETKNRDAAERLEQLAREWTRAEAVDAVKQLLYAGDAAEEYFSRLPAPNGDGLMELYYRDVEPEVEKLVAMAAPGGALAGASTELRDILGAPGFAALEQNDKKASRLILALEELASAGAARPTKPHEIAAAAFDVLPHATTAKNEFYKKGSRHFLFGAASLTSKEIQMAAWEWYERRLDDFAELQRLLAELPGPGDLALVEATVELWRLAGDARKIYEAHLERRHCMHFDQMLRRTRDFLVGNEDILGILRGRYRQIMVDEFQDTDGLQWEIVRLLAGEGKPGSEGESLAHARLFLVGDDKQSIYRFRGADVSVFRAACDAIAASAPPAATYDAARYLPLEQPEEHRTATSPVLTLDENFRSNANILRFANTLFGRLFTGGAPGAPAYEPQAQDLLPPGGFSAANVPGESRDILLGLFSPIEDAAPATDNEARQAPPSARPPMKHQEAVALAVAAALGKFDGSEGGGMGRRIYDAKLQAHRPAEAGDVMVLMQKRTHLESLQRHLQRLEIPFVVEKGIGFYEAQEVRDVRNLLAFLADARDDVSLFGVLRGPLFALTDQALAVIGMLEKPTWWERLLEADRRLNGDPARPEDQGWRDALHPSDIPGVGEAVRLLTHWRELSVRVPVAEMIQIAWEQTAALALFDEQELANFDKLIDMARASERRGYAGLDDFVRRMIEAEDENNRVREGAAEVSDAGQAVRLMTVHASKGLEAPIVVLADLKAPSRANTDAVVRLTEFDAAKGRDATDLVLRAPRHVRNRFDPTGNDKGKFSRLERIKEALKKRDEAESRRLFYVAVTRARDALLLVAPDVGATKAEGVWSNMILRILEEERGQGYESPTEFWKDAAQREAWPGSPDDAEPTGDAPIDDMAARTPLAPLIQPIDLDRLRDLRTSKSASAAKSRERGRDDAQSFDLSRYLKDGASDVAPLLAGRSFESKRGADALHPLSPSGVGLLDRCPYCYYRRAFLAFPENPNPAVRKPVRQLRASEFGQIVHRAFLEGAATEEACRELARREAAGFGLFLRDEKARTEIERVGARVWRQIERYLECPLAKELEAFTPRRVLDRERMVTLNEAGLFIRGKIDLLARPSVADEASRQGGENAWTIIDFKTDDIKEDATCERHADAKGYRLQVDLYALAIQRLLAANDNADAPAIECMLYFTQDGEGIRWRFDAARETMLAQKLQTWGDLHRNGFAGVAPTPGCRECSPLIN